MQKITGRNPTLVVDGGIGIDGEWALLQEWGPRGMRINGVSRLLVRVIVVVKGKLIGLLRDRLRLKRRKRKLYRRMGADI